MTDRMDHPLTDESRASRQIALEVSRGVSRLLKSHGLACIAEFSLANGRRADLIAVSASGEIWIVEVKSSVADFRGDQKWPEYLPYCDRFFFAVPPSFPSDLLSPEVGHISADRFSGEILRDSVVRPMAGARRRAITLKLFRTAALRLQERLDPENSLT